MTYSELETYWTDIVINDPDLKAVFFVSDWSEIMEFQVKRSAYPCLIVELFEVDDDNEGVATDLTVQGAYTVLKGMKSGLKNKEYRKVRTKMLTIAYRIKEKLVCDGDAIGLFEFALKGTAHPVSKVTADNAYGYRRNFSIGNITIDTSSNSN